MSFVWSVLTRYVHSHRYDWSTVAVLAASAACADEITVVSNVLGPEVQLSLTATFTIRLGFKHAVEVDGKTATVLNHIDGCGHNGLVLTNERHSSSPALTTPARSWNLT